MAESAPQLPPFPLYCRSKQPPPLAEQCVVCGADLGASRVSIVLAAGALLEVDSSNAVPDDRMLGFLSMSYHRVVSLSSHENNDVFTNLTLIEDAIGGQYELGFCSVKCVRLFFEQLTERFAQTIDEAERDASRSPKP